MVAQDTKAIQKVNTFMRSTSVKSRFIEMMGERNAVAYISSVMLAVANDESGNLAQCNPESVYISAMRAATLRLSVDPSTGQAYLVPFGKKATLIVGYKGLQDMAVRTGKYRYINTNPIYEGETVTPNRISGLITLESLGGKRTGDKIIGWLAAFEMNPEKGQKTGYAHTLYMTVEEIHEHAKKYSSNYGSSKSGWKTNPTEMERKTILRRLLRKWGYMAPTDAATLEEVESEGATIVAEAEFTDAPALEDKAPKNEAQLMTELGNGNDPVSDTMWHKYLSKCQEADALSLHYDNKQRTEWNNATLGKAYSELEAFIKIKTEPVG